MGIAPGLINAPARLDGRASCVMNVFAFLAVKMDFAKNLWNVNVMKGGQGCYVTNLIVVTANMDTVVLLEFVPAMLVTLGPPVMNVFQTQIVNMVHVEITHLNVIAMRDLRVYFATNLFVEKDVTLNMECASSLKNVGVDQVGKERIVLSVSLLPIVSMVIVTSLLNASVIQVMLGKTVRLPHPSMEIGVSGDLGQIVGLIAIRPETVLAITHPPLEGGGIAQKMAHTHLKHKPVLNIVIVVLQLTVNGAVGRVMVHATLNLDYNLEQDLRQYWSKMAVHAQVQAVRTEHAKNLVPGQIGVHVPRHVEVEFKPELELVVQESKQIALKEQFMLKKDPVMSNVVL